MVEARYWIWFQLMFGFGSSRSHNMLEQEPCPKELYQKIQQKQCPTNYLFPNEWNQWSVCMEQAKKLEAITIKKQCDMITPDHPHYPSLLHHIYAKPAVLYVKGDLSYFNDALSFTIVGARRETEYGRKVTTFLSEGLAQSGATILSGLAFGIDSLALESAVKTGGHTVGILACGLDYDYPKGNATLKRKVAEHGAVLTEYPMGTKPKPYMFPPRNRVLAGMSHGVVVIEAGENSGSLITANHALEYGRDVFVPPGGIFSGTFAGSHGLIREGVAKLVASPEDILEEYINCSVKFSENTKNSVILKEDISKRNPKPQLPEHMDHLVQEVYEHMSDKKQNADTFAYLTSAPIGDILGALTTLEILGFAKSHPGGYFTLL